jgi:ferric-dicitrate binding protein FerR (iron transport regulator)
MSLIEAKQFVAQFVKGDYTPEEYAAFLQWLKGATVEELNVVADAHEALAEQWNVEGLVPSERWKARLEGKLDEAVYEEEEVPVRVIGENWFMRRRGWIAAASVAVLVAGGVVLYTESGRSGSRIKADNRHEELAMLTKEAVNPRGGAKREVVLADGSKVLLNVASTLRYPETFDSSERVVELSGEGYFNVVPNATKPFRVLIKDAEVDVLGTTFNVRAYADDQVSRTTLIEGSIAMQLGSQKATLKPGQQAVIAYPSTGEIEIAPRVDMDVVTAWQKGYYQFTNEEIQTVMRVLSRYYNVDIQCDPRIEGKTVSGAVSRDKGLKENISQFESMGFKFSLKDQIMKVTL